MDEGASVAFGRGADGCRYQPGRQKLLEFELSRNAHYDVHGSMAAGGRLLAKPPSFLKLLSRPGQNGLEARRRQLFRLVEAHPAPVMLGDSEFRRDRQGNGVAGGFGQVVARDLAVAIGCGFAEHLAPAKGEIGDRGRLRGFTDGCIKGVSFGSTALGKSQLR